MGNGVGIDFQMARREVVDSQVRSAPGLFSAVLLNASGKRKGFVWLVFASFLLLSGGNSSEACTICTW